MYGYLKFAFKSIMPTKLISMNPFLLCWTITFRGLASVRGLEAQTFALAQM